MKNKLNALNVGQVLGRSEMKKIMAVVQIVLYVHGIIIVFAGIAGLPTLLHLQDVVMEPAEMNAN